MSEFFVGCRVRDDEGFKATIRYIGPVAIAKNKTEIWYGVEWDDKTRGKHDGSCVDESGTSYRYFKCDYGAGSFIRGNKLNKGLSLVEALRDRYVDINAPSILAENSTALPDGFFTTSKGNQKSIEFVGEKKIRYVLIYSKIVVTSKPFILTNTPTSSGKSSNYTALKRFQSAQTMLVLWAMNYQLLHHIWLS